MADDGFELSGEFYVWHIGTQGRYLMLLDKLAEMPVDEFFERVEDAHERTRTPILFTLIAMSLAYAHPEWTNERIVRTLMDMEMSDLRVIVGDEDDGTDDQAAPPLAIVAEPSGNGSSSESSSTSSATNPATSETFSATPD